EVPRPRGRDGRGVSRTVRERDGDRAREQQGGKSEVGTHGDGILGEAIPQGPPPVRQRPRPSSQLREAAPGHLAAGYLPNHARIALTRAADCDGRPANPPCEASGTFTSAVGTPFSCNAW